MSYKISPAEIMDSEAWKSGSKEKKEEKEEEKEEKGEDLSWREFTKNTTFHGVKYMFDQHGYIWRR